MTDKVELPISSIVKGIQWSLYTFQFNTPDGEFCGYFHAISDEHAAAMLSEMKETSELKGRMVEAKP